MNIQLDDNSVIQILKTIAKARLSGAVAPGPGARETLTVLANAFGGPHHGTATEGDLARAALGLLAEDSQYAEPIRIMSNASTAGGANPEVFIDPASVTVTAAALLVLQTRVKWKRDSSGKWSFEIEKKASGDGAVKLVVERLLALLPH